MSVKRTVINAIPIPELPGWESRLVMLEFPPGVSGTLHTHPVIGNGYVVEGDTLSQFEGGDVEKYSTGDGFIDWPNKLHIRTENLNADKPLKMLVAYVIKVGQANVVPIAS